MIRAFISCVRGEFGDYRIELSRHLHDNDIHADVQENLGPAGVDVLQKLDAVIQGCDVVVQLLGDGAGSVVRKSAVTAFLNQEDRDGKFSDKMARFGDFRTMELTYTQWEVFLAEYREKCIIVYQAMGTLTDGNPKKGQYDDMDWPRFNANLGDQDRLNHYWDLLHELRVPQYRTQKFASRSDFMGKCPGDIKRCVLAFRQAARFGPHEIASLKSLLRVKGAALIVERFLLTAVVQFTKKLPAHIGADPMCDLDLINVLANLASPLDLLGLVRACERRSAILGLDELSGDLARWLLDAFNVFGTTEMQLSDYCVDAMTYLDAEKIATPSLEIAWWPDPRSPARHVIAESYLRWGRYYKNTGPTKRVAPVPNAEAPTHLNDTVSRSDDLMNVPIERLDIFVLPQDLYKPWEYRYCTDPDEDSAIPLKWPTVLRLLDRDNLASAQPPPDPVSRRALACHLGPYDAFRYEVWHKGAFFCLLGDDASSREEFGWAATRAGLGFWIRKPAPTVEAEDCLNALEGNALAAIPRLVREKKHIAPKGSAWRNMGLLFDRPGWPGFMFSYERYDVDDDVKTQLRLN